MPGYTHIIGRNFVHTKVINFQVIIILALFRWTLMLFGLCSGMQYIHDIFVGVIIFEFITISLEWRSRNLTLYDHQWFFRCGTWILLRGPLFCQLILINRTSVTYIFDFGWRSTRYIIVRARVRRTLIMNSVALYLDSTFNIWRLWERLRNSSIVICFQLLWWSHRKHRWREWASTLDHFRTPIDLV